MTADNKTLADVQPDGRVRLGDALLPCPFCGNDAEFVPYKDNGLTLKCKSMGCIQRHQRTLRYGIDWLRTSMTEHWNTRALSAQPSPGGQEYAWNIAELVRVDLDRQSCPDAYMRIAMESVVKHLAARQPVGEPVTNAGRSAAYDAIDRFLRNNMDDEAYAAYVEHLEALWAAVPAQSVNTPQPVAFDYPKFKAVGMGCVLEDRGVHFLIDAAQCGFDEALGQMKATLESIGPLYAAPPAQAVDLGPFREAVQEAYENADSGTLTKFSLEELLALIDSQAVGK